VLILDNTWLKFPALHAKSETAGSAR